MTNAQEDPVFDGMSDLEVMDLALAIYQSGDHRPAMMEFVTRVIDQGHMTPADNDRFRELYWCSNPDDDE